MEEAQREQDMGLMLLMPRVRQQKRGEKSSGVQYNFYNTLLLFILLGEGGDPSWWC